MPDDCLPDDLAARWSSTEWSIKHRANDLYIAFATYPQPACYAIARRYDATLEELASRHAFGAAPKMPAKRKKKPQQEQQELWLHD